MKVFVTGATGFLGSHLVDRLLEKKWEVHLLVRKSSNLQWLLGKKVHYHYGDIVGDGRGLREGLKGVDVCFHLAGVIVAARPATYYSVNAQGTANVLETCLKVNPKIGRVVVVTSIAAHGPNPNDEPAVEEDECHPLTDYGRSKRDAELITFRYIDRLPVTMVRPPAIYGPRDRQFFPFFQLARRGLVFLTAPRKAVANIAYVQDVVTGLILAAEHPKAVGEIFFVGDSKNYTWGELSDIIAKSVRKNYVKIQVPKVVLYGVAGLLDGIGRLTGRTPLLNLGGAKNLVQNNWGLAITKAQKLLGYHPAYSLRKGVDETAAWYFEEEWL